MMMIREMVLWSVAVVEFMEITHLIDAEIRVVLKVARCWLFVELQTKDFNADHVNDNVCETFVFWARMPMVMTRN